MRENEIEIGNINFNTSCSYNSTLYPFGAIMFGRNHKQSTDKITDITVVIANDSEEGIQLDKMLKEKVDAEKIKEFIFELILKNKTISEIKCIIDKQLNQKYNDGVSEGKYLKQREITNVLGI